MKHFKLLSFIIMEIKKKKKKLHYITILNSII